MKQFKKYGIHILLFIITLFTTTLAGVEWTFGRSTVGDGGLISSWLTQEKFLRGFHFSLPFLLFLTCHEFGHYFTAKYHRVKVTLPYYIPFWLGITQTFGTMGAFIQIKSPLKTPKEFFDIGIAGPLAGFVVALGILFYGFTHLPPPEYVLEIHPEYIKDYPAKYEQYGADYEQYVYQYPDTEENREKGRVGEPIKELNIAVGKNLLFLFFENFVATQPERIPHRYEMMHYPYLFAGFLALLFTALNLMPIGQLDGGHILYGLIGYKNHRMVAPVLFVMFVFYAGLGVVRPIDLARSVGQANSVFGFFNQLVPYLFYVFLLYVIFSRTVKGGRNVLLLSLVVFTSQFVISFFFPQAQGYAGWLAFAFLLGRVLGVYHPPAMQEGSLSRGRQVLGWIALFIFVISFSPQPLLVE